jgi:putative flippase GtrA
MRTIKIKMLTPVFTHQAVRFIISGGLVTGLHVIIAATIINIILPVPPIANGVAFVIATAFSYLINTLWSFSRPLHGRNLFRFSVVSFSGLFLTINISGAAQYYGLHYWYGIGLVVCIVTPFTFFVHRFWTYR